MHLNRILDLLSYRYYKQYICGVWLAGWYATCQHGMGVWWDGSTILDSRVSKYEFLGTNFAFGYLAANVRVWCRDFSKLRVYAVYSNRRPPSLFGEHCEILRWRTLKKTLKRWWGRLKKRWVATESGGDEIGDETGEKTVATAGDERDGVDRWGKVYGRRSVYNRHPTSLIGEHYEILRWRKTLKR